LRDKESGPSLAKVIWFTKVRVTSDHLVTTIMPEEDISIVDNALGLDFAEKSDKQDLQPSQELSDSPDLTTVKKEKEKPYVNLERVKTGGPQRVRSLSLYLYKFYSHIV
jgi:hypothetical protein